jgi:transposase-like protein
MFDKERLKAMLAEGQGVLEIIKAVVSELLCELLMLEADIFLNLYRDERLEDGTRRFVRNGFSEVEILTGNGPIKVRKPRIRDLGGGGEKKVTYDSSLIPKHLRRTEDVDNFIPWLYLRGVSSSNVGGALSTLFNEEVKGVSANTVCRLIKGWEDEYDQWLKRGIEGKFGYIWVDGIFFRVRSERENQCILAALGAREDGQKELLGFTEGFAESKESWKELLVRLRSQGLNAPRLVIGDAGLGIWSGLREVFPDSRQQSCWFHQIKTVRDYLPRSQRNLVTGYLRDVYLSPTEEAAEKAIKVFSEAFREKYPKAVESVSRRKDTLLSFYGFPAAHWSHIRTNNPIESIFSAVRNRTSKTRGMVSRRSLGAMVFKLCQIAQASFIRLRKAEELKEVIKGREYKNGLPVD